MAETGEEEQQARPIDLAISFHAADLAVPTNARRLTLSRAGDRWTSCQLQLEVVPPAWKDLQEHQFFGDTTENRLGGEDLEFDRALPLWLEVALRSEYLPLLPSPAKSGLDGVAHALSQPRSTPSPLFGQDAWRTLQVWQEHPLDPSIGGGVFKVGYRTTWSPIRDTVDMLKRRGAVSRTLVEAFIEHGLPVHFDPEADALAVTMRAGERTYPCTVSADDAASALAVAVELDVPVPKKAESAVASALARINEDLPIGRFVLAAGKVSYQIRTRTSGPLLNYGLVIESLRAAVSLMHQHAPELLVLIHP